MTEKRFQWVFIKDNELEFQDNGIVKRFENNGLEEFLNELNEENKQLQNDCSILIQSNQEYRKENEQLKKELKRCRNWLNSDKNDYELTLAFIKNKGYSLKDVLEYEKELKSE